MLPVRTAYFGFFALLTPRQRCKFLYPFLPGVCVFVCICIDRHFCPVLDVKNGEVAYSDDKRIPGSTATFVCFFFVGILLLSLLPLDLGCFRGWERRGGEVGRREAGMEERGQSNGMDS